MINKSSVLIISFRFAPDSRVGGKRFTFLSKIFQKKYSEVHVLTLQEKYINSKDEFLSPGVAIHRTGIHPAYPLDTNNIFKKILNKLWRDYFCLVDPESGWIFPAVFRGLKVIKENKIGLIITTGPPFSTHVIGFMLSIMTKAKLILDYRDPWNNRLTYKQKKGVVKSINNMLERLCVRKASALVFCTQWMKDDFVKHLGQFNKSDLYVINNAYENNEMIQPDFLSKNKICMIYAGALYGERQIGLLTEAISKLIKEGIINKDNFCFKIFGKLEDQDREAIKQHHLQDIIFENPLVPHQQLIRYLKGADILVLIVSNDMSYSVSYKFYDYLSAKRPIFAIVPDNSQMQEMMQEIDCGQTANINKPETIFNTLRAMLLEEREYTYSGAERFTWDESARKYSEVIRSLQN
jgi:glycosyltransferase involved in cell wall biosynthesis